MNEMNQNHKKFMKRMEEKGVIGAISNIVDV